MPEEVKVKFETQYQSYNLLDLREISMPSGMTPTEISWDGVLYGAPRMNEKWLIRKWYGPDAYINTFKDWQKKGEVIRVVISGTYLNIDATIASFEVKPYGGYGDYKYSISFKEYNNDSVVVTAVVPQPSGGGSGGNQSGKTYTVRRGDCMWNIAQRFYGCGAKWPTIYKANKDVIEKTARRYGHRNSCNGWWIFPGTVLIIP